MGCLLSKIFKMVDVSTLKSHHDASPKMTKNLTCTDSFQELFSKDCWWYSILAIILGLLVLAFIGFTLWVIAVKTFKMLQIRCCIDDPPSNNTSFSQAFNHEKKHVIFTEKRWKIGDSRISEKQYQIVE